MAIQLRPTGHGSGIDEDRADYTVYTGTLAASKRLGAVLSICADFARSLLPNWLKFKNPEAPAVRREAEEDRGK